MESRANERFLAGHFHDSHSIEVKRGRDGEGDTEEETLFWLMEKIFFARESVIAETIDNKRLEVDMDVK